VDNAMQDVSFITAQLFVWRSELPLLLDMFPFEAAWIEAEGRPGTCEKVRI
jgi:hypothetical protein